MDANKTVKLNSLLRPLSITVATPLMIADLANRFSSNASDFD
jgi:hypothetical protein